jgi:hypothetical protein
MSATEIKVGRLGINYIVDGSHTQSLGMFELTVPPGLKRSSATQSLAQ